MSNRTSILDSFSEPFDFSYMPPHIADDIYWVAVECARLALSWYGHDDEESMGKAHAAIKNVFISKCGLNCSWLEDCNKVDNFDIVTAMENQEIVERIAAGAELEGLTMVDWVIRAINKQFVEDSIAKAERDGELVWNGEYRDRKPVFVNAQTFRKMVN